MMNPISLRGKSVGRAVGGNRSYHAGKPISKHGESASLFRLHGRPFSRVVVSKKTPVKMGLLKWVKLVLILANCSHPLKALPQTYVSGLIVYFNYHECRWIGANDNTGRPCAYR